jgi:AcrR family transcriptional regulator
MRIKSSTARRRPPDDSVGRQRILKAAKATFIRHGGAEFSARAVAKEAGVSLRAVQHFFSTTDLLLAGVLEFLVEEFDELYRELFVKLPFNGEARLLGVVDILLDSNWKQETRRIYYGLYALGCHNKFAAALIHRVLGRHLEMFAALIGGARPHLTEKRCWELAAHLAATIDGAMLLTEAPRDPYVNKAALSRIVKSSLLELLGAAPRKATMVNRSTGRAKRYRSSSGRVAPKTDHSHAGDDESNTARRGPVERLAI